MEPLTKKNYQGFAVVGLDFIDDFGQNTIACCQFIFRGHEISISPTAEHPNQAVYNIGPETIRVINTVSGKIKYISGTVENAIDYVINQTA
jgi:hypothetical protein